MHVCVGLQLSTTHTPSSLLVTTLFFATTGAVLHMGYTTCFEGHFDVCPVLDKTTEILLQKVHNHEEDLDVEKPAPFGFGDHQQVLDDTEPPQPMPDEDCQWIYKDGQIKWDKAEKFYCYIEWLKYIVDKILAPRSYVVNGTVQWQGEDEDDYGAICVENNQVHCVKLSSRFSEWLQQLFPVVPELQLASTPEGPAWPVRCRIYPILVKDTAHILLRNFIISQCTLDWINLLWVNC